MPSKANCQRAGLLLAMKVVMLICQTMKSLANANNCSSTLKLSCTVTQSFLSFLWLIYFFHCLSLQRNYQFDFLRPQHSLFNYFTKLVEQYTKVRTRVGWVGIFFCLAVITFTMTVYYVMSIYYVMKSCFPLCFVKIVITIYFYCTVMITSSNKCIIQYG